MLFDEKKSKGIRRKSLPEPNPTAVDIDKNATLKNLCEKAME